MIMEPVSGPGLLRAPGLISGAGPAYHPASPGTYRRSPKRIMTNCVSPHPAGVPDEPVQRLFAHILNHAGALFDLAPDQSLQKCPDIAANPWRGNHDISTFLFVVFIHYTRSLLRLPVEQPVIRRCGQTYILTNETSLWPG